MLTGLFLLWQPYHREYNLGRRCDGWVALVPLAWNQPAPPILSFHDRPRTVCVRAWMAFSNTNTGDTMELGHSGEDFSGTG